MKWTGGARNAKEASSEAVHKVKSAQQAIEIAREAQIEQTLQQAAENTKGALVDALKEVFGDGDDKDPEQMRILVRRIPILCTNIASMHADLAQIKENIQWVVRIVIGAVLLAILKLVIF